MEKNNYRTNVHKTLYYSRVATLVSSAFIVLGSITFYSLSSTPLDISKTSQNIRNDDWLAQTIIDRRFISTLVASQASIFCSFFVLMANITIELTDSAIETTCQLLMPLGLAICWIFSVFFDLKSAHVIGQSVLCLTENNCLLFSTIHTSKYVVIGSLLLETIFIVILYIEKKQTKFIQLPLKDEESTEKL